MIRLDRTLIPDMPSAEELVPFLKQIDACRWYTNFGPLSLKLERDIADLLAQKHKLPTPPSVISVANGYQAIVLGLHMLGVGAGDNVLIPAVTFPACPLAVQRLGATPLLADIDRATALLTPETARRIAEKTRLKAVMPVGLYGLPVPQDAWDAFARDTGIAVLVDAAAGFETQKPLAQGLIIHSLHATKPFGCGEGGLLIGPQDSDFEKRAHSFCNFGTINRLALSPGENAKMSDYHAAVALAQLNRWEGIKAARQKLYTLYADALTASKLSLHLHPQMDTIIVNAFMLHLEKPHAEQVLAKLETQGVMGHRTYFPPLPHHPHFAALPLLDNAGLPATPHSESLNCNILADRLIGLPFHRFMTESDVAFAVKKLGEAL